MITVQNITVTVDKKMILSDISFSVPPGSRLHIQGPSGCGKSTLLKCLMGFVVPQHGSITINNTELNGSTVWQLRRQIAYVSQEPTFPALTSDDLLRRTFHYHHNRGIAWDNQRIDVLFERFLLSPDCRHTLLSDLSGGEKQRVALIHALLLQRPIMLLDEPTSALDETAKAAVLDYFLQCHDLTLLYVTHDHANFNLDAETLRL